MRLIRSHDHVVICGNPRQPACTKRRTTGLNNIYYMPAQGFRLVRAVPRISTKGNSP